MLVSPPAGISLPVIKSLADCADFSKTVTPYIPQLYELPTRVFASLTDASELQQLYVSTNPLISAFAFSLALVPIFLIVSEIRQNYSQVDCCWPILPTTCNAHFAIWARLNGVPSQRTDNLIAFSIVWGIRLTFNYWRRGGYNFGAEDYRWELVRKTIGGVAFFLLNVFFISSVQSVLLFAITMPGYILILVSRIRPEMSFTEVFLARLLILLVGCEVLADQQMWNYQQAKKSYQKTAKVPQGWTRAQMDRGFITSGLWKYSRHPNFAAEQAIWLTLYQWGSQASETVWNWTAAGAISYLLLFQASTPLTEWITGQKYPEYKLYQERVGQFVPTPLTKGWNEAEMEKLGQQSVKEDGKKK